MKKNAKITVARASAERDRAKQEEKLERERAAVVYGSFGPKKPNRAKKIGILMGRIRKYNEQTREILRSLRPGASPCDAKAA